MKLFDFQTQDEACLNHADVVCKQCTRQREEISCVPMCRDPKGLNLCREVIRQPLPALSSRAAVSHVRRGSATSPQVF